MPKVSDAAELRINPRRLDLDLQDVGWVAGKPFIFRVTCSGKTSYFERELSYYEDRLLILRVEFDDGFSGDTLLRVMQVLRSC